MGILNNYLKLAASLIGIILFLGCSGKPLGPVNSDWILRVEADPEYPIFGALAYHQDGSVFVIGMKYTYFNIIYRYNESGLIVDYIPQCGNYAIFDDIAFYDKTGWAVGEKKNSEHEYVPYIVYYNGTKWSELYINNDDINELTEVVGINETDCWLLSYNKDDYNRLNTLVKNEDGIITVYDNISSVKTIAYDNKNDILYCLCDIRDHSLSSTPNWKILITDNGGNSWVTESIETDSSIYEIGDFYERYHTLYAIDGTLFLNPKVIYGSHTYRGAIIKRTGQPGNGIYEPLFFTNMGPYFFDFRSMAFKDEHHGIVIGQETSVLYNEPDWLLESVSGYNYFHNTPEIVAGTDGYWAVSGYEGSYCIMYHPY